MKKNTILALVFGALSLITNAAPRTPEQAVAVAQEFVSQLPAYQQNTFQLKLSNFKAASMRRVKGAGQLTPAYYIVNIGEDQGYLVISGDDRFKTVLGYTPQGRMEQGDVLPDGMQYWLDFLSSEMQAAIDAGYDDTPKTGVHKLPANDGQYVQSVEPLVTTQWNQKAPYNIYKIQNYATGCVATGMAQVMKYWKYPVRGTGNHTNAYFSDHSADFGATTYDWDNMLDRYTGKESPTQCNAVATLMYHLGVATDMRWTGDNSGTPNMYAAVALVKFFGYNKNLYSETRDQMSLGAWKGLILQQLYTGHPLCYSGMSEGSKVGHFFVLDGYDAPSGMFHFNWGWGGAFDGYYEITSLEPGGQGQAGAGAGSYNYDQQIFVNVQPSLTGDYVAHFDAIEVKPVGMSQSKNRVTMSTSYMSNNAVEFKGTIGLALYHADGSLAQYLPAPVNFPGDLKPGSTIVGDLNIPVDMSQVQEGTYTVCVAVQHQDYQNTAYPVRAKYGNSTYYNVTVQAGNVTFANIQEDFNITDTALPVVLSPTLAPNTVYQNVVSTFQVKLKNTGTSVFNDEVGVCIQKGSRDGNRQYMMVPCTLLPGEEKTVNVIGKVLRDPGTYNLVPCYGENGVYVILSQAQEITVGEEIDAIEHVSPNAQSQNVFNLQGVRMPQGSNLPKGLYIIGGRKVLK